MEFKSIVGVYRLPAPREGGPATPEQQELQNERQRELWTQSRAGRGAKIGLEQGYS